MSNLSMEMLNELITELTPYFKHDIPIVDPREVDAEAEGPAEDTDGRQDFMEDSSDQRRNMAPNSNTIGPNVLLASETNEKERMEVKPNDDGETSNSTSIFSSPEYPNGTFTLVQSSTDSSDMDLPDSTQKEQRSSAQEAMHEITALSTRPQASNSSGPIAISQRFLPKSRDSDYVPPLPISTEQDAVQKLLHQFKDHDCESTSLLCKGTAFPSTSNDVDFVEFKLSEFSIYLPENRYNPFEMRPLSYLAGGHKAGEFMFDGILSVGKAKHYVQAVPFNICSIGNYGKDIDEVGDSIWLQSYLNSKTKIYYRLVTPAPEYVRFHDDFKWVAELAKHFVDFCQTFGNDEVSVFHFRTQFSDWIEKTYDGSVKVREWRSKYGKDDFRQPVVANINFLHKEANGIEPELLSNPIWAELLNKDFIPKQPTTENKTVVTPYVYECFKHLRFAHHLKSVSLNNVSESQHSTLGKSLNLTPIACDDLNRLFVEIPSCRQKGVDDKPTTEEKLEHQQKVKEVKVGDVLSVTKDGEGSVWKDEMSKWKAVDECWYVYVQGIHEDGGERSFDAFWLYRSSDTCCAKMKYPFKNELFMSDNCTCENGRITADEVLDIVPVVWDGQPPISTSQLFIRQTYLENERFVTLKEAHKTCEHLKAHKRGGPPALPNRYRVGQTVLVEPRHKKHALEPYEVIRYEFDHGRRNVILRRLRRRKDIDGKGRPNELVYTDKTEKFAASRVKQTCFVRFYSEDDVARKKIPVPYNRDGTGNAFYITMQQLESEAGYILKPIMPNPPKGLIQGFDPTAPPRQKRLRGMDLYCGGGNFGRGLQEAGAVHHEWAVDIGDSAIHTYHANLQSPTETKLFWGSVNDLLAQAIAGNPEKSDLIPLPGEVEFISAGSPCQGFSILNLMRDDDKGLLNQSLVASVAAYIDFYRPKYGLLENVLNMAQKGRGRDEDVLSQLICAIVGMGYQFQLFVVDAWSCGSPQVRSRLFASFAAPGLEILEQPRFSHSHPSNVKNVGLGKLANGESFGRRITVPTPFEYVTAEEACQDLPAIGDGQTYHCIPFPYHVSPQGATQRAKLKIQAIPLRPYGSNFVKAWDDGKGVMTRQQRDLFPFLSKNGTLRELCYRGSHAWGRVVPNALFPTVITAQCAEDARMGACLHWDEHRYITVAEAQRAQSFPDDEVLVGTRTEQHKILGNSVARSVALSLGLSLRDAWFKRSNPNPTPKRVSSMSSTAVPRVTRSGKSQSQSDESHNSEGVSSTDEIQAEAVISNTVRIREQSQMLAAENSEDSPEDLSDEPSEGLSDTSAEEAITKESFSRLIRAFELSEASSSRKVAPATEDKAEIRTVSTMSDGTAKDGKSRQSSFSDDNSAYNSFENNTESPLKRPYHVPQDTRILPPNRDVAFLSSSGSDSASSKRNRSDSSSMPSRSRTPLPPRRNNLAPSMSRRNSRSKIVESTVDEVVFMAERKRQLSNSDCLAEALRHVKEEFHLQNPAYFADGDEDSDSDLYSNRRFDSESGTDEMPSRPPIPKYAFEEEVSRPPIFASPAHKKRFESRLIRTPRTGKGKTPVKLASKPQYFVNLVSDDEGESAAKETSRPLAPVAKYVPVDNSGFSAYAQTHRYMGTSQVKRQCRV